MLLTNVDVKMPNIVGILKFISRISFSLMQLNCGILCQKKPGKLHILTILRVSSLSRSGMVLHVNALYVHVSRILFQF